MELLWVGTVYFAGLISSRLYLPPLVGYLIVGLNSIRGLGLDADPTVLEQLLADGRRVIYGDAEDTELLETIPLAKIKGIVLTMPEFEVRTSSIKQLKMRQFTGHIGTVCFHHDEENKLYQSGAAFVIHPLSEAGKQLAEQMLNSARK